jgi:enamine deaminase RidA (YjgF/YER057c/UK114 family)
MATKPKRGNRGGSAQTRKPAKKAGAVKKAVARKPAAAAIKPFDIDPGWAWDDRLPFVQGKQVGNLVYVSGQVALDRDGKLVGEGDIRAQTRQALENVKTILAAAGLGPGDIVKLNSYITEAGLYRDFSDERSKIFGSHRPASTVVAVSGLAFPGLMVEIEAIALKQ